MPTVLYKQTAPNKWEPVSVPNDQVASAYASGLRPAKGQQIDVFSKDGERGTIDSSDLGQLLTSGGSVVSDQDLHREQLEATRGTLGQQALTVGENALSTTTLGGSDVALAGIFGDEYRQARAERAKANPGAALAGQIGGAVVPLLLSGGGAAPLEGAEGASALASAGKAAEGVAGAAESAGLGSRALDAASAAGRVIGAPTRGVAALGEGTADLVGHGLGALGATGETAAGRALVSAAKLGAQGAVEGALQGAGQGLSEAALAPNGDYDHLAERVLAGAKDGALFGGIGGAGLGFLGSMASTAGSKLLDHIGGSEAIEQGLKDFAAQRLTKSLGATKADIARMGNNAQAIESKMRSMYDDVLSYTMDDGSKLVKVGEKAEDFAPRMREAQQEVGQKLGDLRKGLSDFIETDRPDLRPDVAGMMQRIDSEVISPLQESMIGGTQKKAEKVLKQLRDFEPQVIDTATGKVLTGDEAAEGLAKGTAAQQYPAVSLEKLQQARQDLDKIVFPKPKGGAGLPQLPKAQEELIAARGIIEDTITSAQDAAALAKGDVALSDRLATLKRQYSNLTTAATLADKGMSAEIGNRGVSLSDYLTGIGTGEAMGMASSALHGLAHGGIVGMGTGLLTSLVHKVVRERASSTIAVLVHAAQSSDRAILDAAKAIVKVPARAVAHGAFATVVRSDVHKSETARALNAKKNESDASAYYRTLDRLNAVAATPEPMDPHAPQTSQAIGMKRQSAAQFLLSKAPVHPENNTTLAGIMAKQTHPAPNPVELAKFSRYVEAVNKPLSVIARVKDGKPISREHVEALRIVYPKLFSQLQTSVAEQAIKSKTPMPYQKRIDVGALFDIPTDNSLKASRIRMAQAVYAQPNGQPPAPQGNGKAPKVAKDFETTVQRIEAGDNSF